MAVGGVAADIRHSRGLPSRWYVEAELGSLEHERLFARAWCAIGVASDIAAPGAILPVELNGMPLIAVRDEAGAVGVFHNVCSHRGMKLVGEPCQVQGLLRCPYHSWSYSLDGRLRATPSIGGPGVNRADGFDKARHGLKPVRSAVWFDQIFVNIDGKAPPFEEFIRPLAERWRAFDPAAFRHGASDSYLRFELACNWKLAVENYCEAYHLPWVHPGLNVARNYLARIAAGLDRQLARSTTEHVAAEVADGSIAWRALPRSGRRWLHHDADEPAAGRRSLVLTLDGNETPIAGTALDGAYRVDDVKAGQLHPAGRATRVSQRVQRHAVSLHTLRGQTYANFFVLPGKTTRPDSVA